MQDDDYNSVRCEYVEMLENQIAKSNNGIVRTKLLTFGVNVDDLSTARARLERVEADICGNFKKLGVKCRSLSGLVTKYICDCDYFSYPVFIYVFIVHISYDTATIT